METKTMIANEFFEGESSLKGTKKISKIAADLGKSIGAASQNGYKDKGGHTEREC